MYDVANMYSYSNSARKPLLSDYDAPFWSVYVANYENFDNVFKNMFKSFKYYDQEPEGNESLASVTARFTRIVKDWLLMNDKRYSELWRVNVVNDNDYSILDNYDITETYSGNSDKTGATTEGARTDVDDLKVGNQKTENVNKVTAFNSNNENTHDSTKAEMGTRNDIDSFTKGEMTTTTQAHENDGHLMRKRGNIGVMTQTDVMKKHVDYWTVYNFYLIVFNDINENYLLV